MYIDDDLGAEVFGQWKLYDNDDNFIESVNSNNSAETELIVGETYKIRVNENASTEPEGEIDRWFLYWEEFENELDLVKNVEIDELSDFEFTVKFKDKISITFSITDGIEGWLEITGV